MARQKIHEKLDPIRAEIIDRWKIPRWPDLFPWWPSPAVVKILMYADGPVRYDGGPFFGLKQVLATLTADPYHWVRFEVTTVHRSTDTSADHDNLDLAAALGLEDFDELWIYGFNSTPQLTTAELAAAKTFMDDREGGVLITGDHANLGAAFGNLPRAGKMRQLPAPPASPPEWNSTLQSGADTTYEFDDQSDDVPQPLRLRWYWGGTFWRRPHPLLCSPLGPIDIFPDHQHEGEAVAPSPTPASEWPAGPAGTEAPEVVAWGQIKDPSATTGREVGVLSVYDGHRADVGRIVADSTWHHHFDINLQGLPGDPGRNGFATPGTTDWLSSATKIEHYFLNTAIWLAPPAKQSRMRFASWWPILWSGTLIELELTRLPLPWLGRRAYDALGRYAPHCAVFGWIWELIPIELQRYVQEIRPFPDPLPILEYVAGLATRRMAEAFRPERQAPLPEEAPSYEQFEKLLGGVAGEAIEALASDLEGRTAEVRELARRARKG